MRAVLFLCLAANALAADGVDVKITPAIEEYCHIVRFPQAWAIQPYIQHHDVLHTVTPLEYTYSSEYEFRTPGELGTRFLVRGLVELGKKYYTKNAYELDLSDPKSVPRPATEAEWDAGTVIPDSRHSDRKTFAYLNRVFLTNSQPLPFHGFQFAKSGDIWPGERARLSPDQSWIVLLSSSGSVHETPDSQIALGFGRDRGKLFMDVYNADTGKKLITIVATYLGINPQALNQALWVTERYFILPLGEQRQRCMVCDFGRADRERGLKP
jgi:hypothetical protein